MQTLLNKAKDLSVKGKEKLGQYNSGKLGSEDSSSSFSRKRREAALKADLFAGPDKIVSAGNTYGLIRLTIHEAKVRLEQRYCAVVSIGMQVSSHQTSSLTLASGWALLEPVCIADLHVQNRAQIYLHSML